jgi:predicted nucleotidyltransferase
VLEPDQVDQVAKLLDERLGLDALWVFGSFASGAVTAESDVDLAALFRRRPSAV